MSGHGAFEKRQARSQRIYWLAALGEPLEVLQEHREDLVFLGESADFFTTHCIPPVPKAKSDKNDENKILHNE